MNIFDKVGDKITQCFSDLSEKDKQQTLRDFAIAREIGHFTFVVSVAFTLIVWGIKK